MNRKQKINCFKCRFFYITWDGNFPYGCKAMGFKSKKYPMAAVYENSGTQCLAFSKKTRRVASKILRHKEAKKF